MIQICAWPKPIAMVFWDLDGTLIDSEKIHAEASAYASSILALQFQLLPKPLTIDTTGMENCRVFALLFGNKMLQAVPQLFNQWEHLAINYVLDNVSAKHQIKPALRLFKRFSRYGIPQTVVSNSHAVVVQHSLKALGILEQCSKIFSRDEVVHGKPHPQLYLQALAYHQQQALNCLAFEDSGSGITAAKFAGLNVVGVGEGSSRYCPDLVLSVSQPNWWQCLQGHYQFATNLTH